MLEGIASRILGQDQDLGFAFEGAGGPFEVLGFGGMEAVHTPFEMHIDLFSEDPGIDIRAMLDTPGLLIMAHKYDELRYFHGIVSEVERGESGIRRTHYSVVLRPTFSRLDHGSDCRIWQEKTVPDIVKQVLGEHGVVDTEWRLEGTHLPREYCVQYHETHRAFVERLLSEEGIFYFFEHSAGGHKMILTDAPLATPILPNAATLPYNAQSGGQTRMPWISNFAQRERVRAAKYEMRDYTFKNPPYNQKHVHIHPENNGLKGNYELYDYPGRYKEPGAGDPFTKHRIESVRVDSTTGQGRTNCVHLQAGFHFTITGHDDDKANIQHFLLSVRHSGSQAVSSEEDAGDSPTIYEATFTTMPGRLPYRPPLARKPVVDGPHIAHVTGPEGEEIYCDEHGRVKVWFLWDRHGQKNETSSCWIRVSQNWAGAGWGLVAIPRIGQEVVVEFLDGDPDQPIVMGRTYHATNKAPYKLPEHKTRMTIKSDTHKGKGFNELRFEDEAGQEEVFIHAQKDRNEKTRNNHTERTDNNFVQSVGHNKAIEVTNNHDEVIGGNMTLSVGPSSIGQIINDTVSKLREGVSDIGKSLGLPGLLNPGEGNQTVTIEKNKAETIGISSLEAVGISKMTSVGKTHYINVGTKMVITVGKSQISLDKSGYVKITGTRFNFSASGPVQINGKDIDLN